MVLTKKTKIGFVGMGIMGAQMALHIKKSGYPLYVYTRRQEKASELLAAGAIWCDSLVDLAREADIIFSIVGFPKDVEDIYLGEDGILNHAKEDIIVCDMTTSEPSLAQKISQIAISKNILSLDAPVSGGDVGAKNATLSIMVGGNHKAYLDIFPLLEIMGKNIVYLGDAGAGQHCKMCNQIAIAGTMMGMIEALRYAEKYKIDLNTLLSAISQGAAGSWSLDNLAPRIVQNNFGPGFLIKHFLKDMKIAQQESEKISLKMPVLDKAIEYYEKTSKAGGDDLGTHGLYQMWQSHPEW